MKKAKIILSAVALFAVVGGALAFKANRFTALVGFTTYTTTVQGVEVTRCSANTSYSTTNNPLAPILTYYTSTDPGNICTGATFTTRVGDLAQEG